MSIYLSDKESTVDKLSYQDYVDALMALIKSPDMETPFTIGIFGPWGSGKSTLINLLDSSLSSDNKFFKVKFNPWLYKDEKDLLIPLFKTILDSPDLQSPLKAISEKLKEILSVTFLTAGDYFFKNLTSTTEKMGELYEKKTDITSHENFKSITFKHDLRKRFQEVVDKLVGEQGRLIILIDDLDRCNDDTIIDLLESIKLFLSVNKCIFILCADFEIIKNGLRKKFNSSNGSEDYLDKLVQLPFFIPTLAEKQIKKFITKEISTKTFKQDTINILIKFLPPIPRKIKRIINMLSFQKELATIRFGKNYSEELLLKTIIIQQRFNDFYRYIDSNAQKKLLDYEKGSKIPDIFDISTDDTETLSNLLKHKPLFESLQNIKKYFSLISIEKESDELTNTRRTLAISPNYTEIFNKFIKTSNYLKSELGRRPEPEEISNEMGIPLEKVNQILLQLKQHFPSYQV